jgi:phosphoserine aminotransferase
VVTAPTDLRIPANLLPSDGRFGCGPSKVRPESVSALAAVGTSLLGTSHRQKPVKSVVGRIRAGLRDLFGLPDGWEVVLGNGGSTVFWDIATFGLIDNRSQHLVFGEFSSKFADCAAAAPHLGDPVVVSSEPGTHPTSVADASIDTYCLTHNETSTGVMAPVRRVSSDGLVVVDATSGAGGLPWSPADADVYYFAPQKCFASDGGLWVALCSPAAVERIERIGASGRWMPASMSLPIALENSRADQTYNTPALATLVLFAEQLDWMNSLGGIDGCVARCTDSSSRLYRWAERSSFASPFVADPAARSLVVGTVEMGSVDHATVCAVLRANGVVDTEPYRRLGRNQLRVGMFPAIDPSDIDQLCASIDWIAEQISG